MDGRRFRKLTQVVHTWVGLNISLLLTFIFFTGTLLVFGPEIDWLAKPAYRAKVEAGADKASFGTIYAAIERDFPQARIKDIYRTERPGFADETIVRVKGNDYKVWTNPYTGQIQGTSSYYTPYRLLRETHARLMMITNKMGRLIVTSLSLVVALLVVSGLIMYRRFWRNFFLWPRRNAGLRIFLSDTHKLTALWLTPFLVIVSLTSLVYFYTVFAALPAAPKIESVAPRASVLPEGFSGAVIDEAAAVAQAAFPDLTITQLRLPQSLRGALVFNGNATAPIVRAHTNTVHVDPVTLTVRGQYRAEDLSFLRRVVELNDPFHWGIWGGLPSRILWFVFGMMATAVAILGVCIYGARTLALAGGSGSLLRQAWSGMHLAKWGLLALIALSFALLVYVAFIDDGRRPLLSEGLRREAGFTSAPLTTRTLVLEPTRPDRTQFGALTYTGGLSLRSPDPRFGGISGLRLSANGEEALAVSDRGNWLRFRLRHDAAGTLVGADRLAIAPLLDGAGRPLLEEEADAEGLERLPGGDLLVAFERQHRLSLYPPPGAGEAVPVRQIALLSLTRALGNNSGVEAIAALDAGRLIAIPETLVDAQGRHTAYLIELAGAGETSADARKISLDAAAGHVVSDATALPDGSVLLLERRTAAVAGPAARIVRVRPSSSDPSVWTSQSLAEFGATQAIDYMEAIAARQDGPDLRIWIMSDDNFNPLQRTLLLSFVLPDFAGPSAPVPAPAS
ncbi:MAG: PepSY domain-containing protein [Alphaproteobacteria bacterium]|nr:PepSY domain-containing protein [Alphaproteobacteria bacterium]